jgi:hypothetical protein
MTVAGTTASGEAGTGVPATSAAAPVGNLIQGHWTADAEL